MAVDVGGIKNFPIELDSDLQRRSHDFRTISFQDSLYLSGRFLFGHVVIGASARASASTTNAGREMGRKSVNLMFAL